MTLVLLLTGLAALHAATAQQDVPFCLQACLTQVGTTLCADHALHDLTPCLATTCPNPPATQNLIASLDVSFTPKAEYACQQAYGPADADKESTAVTLPLNGTCATSPYQFKSFLPQGVSRIRASNGCRVMTFSEEDCLGETASSDIGTLTNGLCVFRGGRSARLTCRNELDAARAYIQTTCGRDDDEGDDNEPNANSHPSSSHTIYPSSAPYHGPGPISSGTDTSSSSIPFHWPFSSSTASYTDTSLTSTADAATGTGTYLPSTTSIATLPSASETGSDNSTAAVPWNTTGVSTWFPSPSDLNGTGVITWTLGSPTADPTSLPPFVGLAADLNGPLGGAQMGVALGLVGAGFVVFL